MRRPIYTTSVGKWQVYKDGLAPLLLALKDTILEYEKKAGLPDSTELLQELQLRKEAEDVEAAAAKAAAAAAEEASSEAAAAVCTGDGVDGGGGLCNAAAAALAGSTPPGAAADA